MHLTGQFGVSMDNTLARKWLQRSAEAGHPEAQFFMGVLLERADANKAAPTAPSTAIGVIDVSRSGSPKTKAAPAKSQSIPDDAERWYLASANQGHAEAAYRLALYMLGEGDSVPHDRLVSARAWLEKACVGSFSDVASAQLLLGSLALQGRGGPVNVLEAVKWFKAASLEHNDPLAQYVLALLLRGKPHRHTMINIDDSVIAEVKAGGFSAEDASMWAQRAASSGLKEAQLLYADMLEAGEGVPANMDEALRWRAIAAADDPAAATVVDEKGEEIVYGDPDVEQLLGQASADDAQIASWSRQGSSSPSVKSKSSPQRKAAKAKSTSSGDSKSTHEVPPLKKKRSIKTTGSSADNVSDATNATSPKPKRTASRTKKAAAS